MGKEISKVQMSYEAKIRGTSKEKFETGTKQTNLPESTNHTPTHTHTQTYTPPPPPHSNFHTHTHTHTLIQSCVEPVWEVLASVMKASGGARPCWSRGLSLESSPGRGRACREGSRADRLGGRREYRPAIVTEAGRGQEPPPAHKIGRASCRERG